MTESYSLEGKRVYVAGHRGMVGSALLRRLETEHCDILSVGRDKVDLRRQAEVEDWMAEMKPQAVFVPAATVGGILANDTRPAEFIYDNLMIETNLIHAARLVGVEKLLFLGSSCIYPKMAAQPMREDALLTGPLESTNQWYAVAKIAGIKLCQAYRRQYGCDFISAMPTNLYGRGDNFDLQSSHVLPALIAKMHAAKIGGASSVTIWGSGTPRREFLYVDDCADALVFLMKTYSEEEHINVGSGTDVTIRELAELTRRVVGFEGTITNDHSKPDGTPRKLMDVSRLAERGWRSSTTLEAGIAAVYSWYLSEMHTV
ncbi:MAG: GDP-L-fucose synthase [Parvibaculum sp.]|uniref:GDP-L-fucose synthase n=1 Tax=Parvibaculum sp. TaxID=2024848 RepID=UPI0025F4D9A6|nr:GDP-L-fucose synthase [Parvibaculum sp.]MCE9649663.1 GDP-L-fucose synthase [Parvibaculum sp.]